MLRCFTGSCVAENLYPATRLDGVSVASGGAVLVMSGVLLGMLHIMPEWSWVLCPGVYCV